ncbi:MAG: hypothetical protein ABWY36_05055 [Leifsonia sp.]
MTELGERALQREIDENRRSEWRLVPQALLALLIVAALVVVRQVYFS